MRIEWKKDEPPRYFDMNGVEIKEGDIVQMGYRQYVVYLTDNDLLGIDATNPKWIETGRAAPCEYGIYPFEESDEPVVIIQVGE